MALRLNSGVEMPRIANLGWLSSPSTETRRLGVWRAISVPLSIPAASSWALPSAVTETGTSWRRCSRFCAVTMIVPSSAGVSARASCAEAATGQSAALAQKLISAARRNVRISILSSPEPAVAVATRRTQPCAARGYMMQFEDNSKLEVSKLVNWFPVQTPLRETQDPQPAWLAACAQPGRQGNRSEEHTSELQSLMRISYAVFCLKKKKNKQQKHQD